MRMAMTITMKMVANPAVVRPYMISNRLVPCVQYSSINSIISYFCFLVFLLVVQYKLLMLHQLFYLTLQNHVMISMISDICLVMLLFLEFVYLSIQPESLFGFFLVFLWVPLELKLHLVYCEREVLYNPVWYNYLIPIEKSYALVILIGL